MITAFHCPTSIDEPSPVAFHRLLHQDNGFPNNGGETLGPGNPFAKLGPFYEFDPIPQYQGRF
jgi:hypothetical protein